jgi:hypothetical protein
MTLPGGGWYTTYNSGMTFTAISALSPLDGRYAAKLATLRPLTSELGCTAACRLRWPGSLP